MITTDLSASNDKVESLTSTCNKHQEALSIREQQLAAAQSYSKELQDQLLEAQSTIANASRLQEHGQQQLAQTQRDLSNALEIGQANEQQLQETKHALRAAHDHVEALAGQQQLTASRADFEQADALVSGQQFAVEEAVSMSQVPSTPLVGDMLTFMVGLSCAAQLQQDLLEAAACSGSFHGSRLQ